MGKYVPPDQEGLTSGNALHKKRPPGMSAGGKQTVRFEMPFAIWCSTCPKPTVIGQGVRFNAVKAKVGMYFSSPIFAFRMRHPACGGEIEIRTDPKNTAYVVVSGAKKRDLGADEESLVKSSRDGLLGGEILTEGERMDMRDAAFRNLEKTIEDREVKERGIERIEELEVGARVWEDPYERNRRLRAQFRVGRHGREREARRGDEIKGRLGLGEEFKLVPGTEEDDIRAKLVDFGGEDKDDRRIDRALVTPLFRETAKTRTGSLETPKDGKEKKKTKPKKQLKSEIVAAKMRKILVGEIVGNTRAARDPFLGFGTASSPRSTTPTLPGLKRKRPVDMEPGQPAEGKPMTEVPAATKHSTAVGLVNYDSD